MFTEKMPLRDEIVGMMNTRPILKQRKPVAEKIISFVETFINGTMVQ